MYKRIASLTLALVILINAFATNKLAASIWQWDEDNSSVTEEEFQLNLNAISCYIYALYQGFEHVGDVIYIYPDFYAGPTVDADGRLVITIIESSLEEARNHESIGPLLKAGVQYKFVEFSHAELNAALHEMSDAVSRARCDRFNPGRFLYCRCNWCIYYARNMTGGHICSTHNRVVIWLYEYNDTMIEGFRRYIFDSPMIMFVQGNWISLSGGVGSIWFTIVLAAVLAKILIGITIMTKTRRM